MNIIYEITQSVLVEPSGRLKTQPPTFACGDQVSVTLAVKRGTGAENLSDCVAWRGALDADLTASTEPMARIPESAFDLNLASSGTLNFAINCRTAEFLAKTNGKRGIPAWLELYGFDRYGNQIRRIRFQVNAEGAVDPYGVPFSPVANDAASQTWVIALLRAGFAVQFSMDAVEWVDREPTGGAKYWRFRSQAANGEWSQAIAIPKGEKGNQGIQGIQGNQGIQGERGPKIESFPPFSPVIAGWEYWLDAAFNRLDLLYRVRGMKKIRLTLASANPAITGNIAVAFVINDIESAVVAIPVGATETEFEHVFATPVSGKFAIVRRIENPLDTLRDGVPVTAVLTNIELEY